MAAVGGGGAGGKGAGDIRAGGAFIDITGKDRLSPLLDKLKARFANAGKLLGIASAAGLTAVGALFEAGVDRVADMQRTADALGLPIEQLSRLQHAADVARVSLEEVMKDPGRFAKLIADAPVIDAATGRKALEFQREMTRATIELKSAFLPLLDVLLPVATTVKEVVKQYGSLLVIGTAVAAGVVGLGLAAGAASALFSVLGTTLLVVKALLVSLITLPGALAAGLAIAAALLLTLTDGGRAFASTVGDWLMGLVATAKQAGAGIMDALRVGDLGLAWKIALAGLSLEWTRFTAYLKAGWDIFAGVFEDTWANVVEGFKLGLNHFGYWWQDFWLGLLGFIDEKFGQKIAPLFRAAADAADLIGLGGGRFRFFADNAGGLGGAIGGARQQNQRDFEARQGAIVDAAAAEQRAREQARNAEVQRLAGGIVQAERELAELVQQAAKKAAEKRDGVRIPSPQQLEKLVRGTFAGGLLGQQLGAGNQFERRQLALSERSTKAIEAVEHMLRTAHGLILT